MNLCKIKLGYAQALIRNMSNHGVDFRPSSWQECCRYLYSILLLLLLPLAFLNLLLRGKTRQIEYAQRKRERFGWLPKNLQAGGYLVHCVSVGEVVAASTIVKAILRDHPDTMVTITTTTPTGSQRVKAIFGEQVQHFYLPYDLPQSMRRLLKTIQPIKVLVTEVELWPNLVHQCWRLKIPIMVINARMTDKSMHNYQKFQALFYPMLQKLSCVCAQGQRDFDNYLQLGMPQARLALTNNIKFELSITAELESAAATFIKTFNLQTRLTWIAASTHEPEESIALHAHQQLLQQHPNLLLIIVPRHPQRFDQVDQLIVQRNMRRLRSTAASAVDESTQVLLLDEMGKLNAAYAASDFAFVGGSIADKGGHNALEAALHGIPSMMGPHTYNNPEICQLLQDAGGLFSVQNQADIVAYAQNWLADGKARKLAGANAKQVIEKNAGALAKTVKQILA